MMIKKTGKLKSVIFIFLITVLVACSKNPETPTSVDTENLEGGSGTLAMVDSVTVELRDINYYATINGNYPDACTRISSVKQVIEGTTIILTLLTARPEGLMCAMMVTPFTVDILLTTGGLMPGEFSVVVNQGPSTTFILE
jgi:hypothetical protein